MCLYLTSNGLPQHPSDIACACAVLRAKAASAGLALSVALGVGHAAWLRPLGPASDLLSGDGS